MTPNLASCAPPPPARLPMQALEEQNLFFIQNSQETEHALDELKQNFGKVQKTMDTKTQVRTEVWVRPLRYTSLVPSYSSCDKFKVDRDREED